MRRLFTAFIAMFFLSAQAAQAATVVQTGTYQTDSGSYYYGGAQFFLPSGVYRFRLDLSGPVQDFFGEVLKVTTTNYLCDLGDGSPAVNCGGDDVPNGAWLDQVGPTRYEGLLTVYPDTYTPVNWGMTVGYDTYESCCTVDFNFAPDTAGQYTLSATALPEAMTWLLMLLGAGAVGGAMRRRRLMAPAFAL